MGTVTTPKYEGLDTETAGQQGQGHKTQAGAVAHNGQMGPFGEEAERQPGQPQGAEPATIMANDLLTQAETDPQTGVAHTDDHELDAFLGKAFEDKGTFAGLYESIRDIFFPQKLPPLELTSKPIPVPDRMAVKANPLAIGLASGINLLILAALLSFGAKVIIEKINKQNLTSTNVEVEDFIAPKAANAAGGGGGGGDHSIVDPIKGKLPKIEKDPVVPPQVQTVDKPKLAMEAAIDVQKNITLPDNPTLPNIGVKNSLNVRLDSNGSGSGGGMGSGSGGGLGSGNGNGYGPGSGGNTGGGLYRIGGSVSAPIALNNVEAEFSDEARRAKYQGVCLIQLIVDAQGNPQNPRVIRALGMGLDEKALEAVRKYKFKPAMKDGRTPVPVMITVEVNFRLY
jgi:TonB family protein